MLHEMSSALGGRASEELVFGKISTGALNDLERVTKQAYAMVAYYGMSSNLKNISFYDSSGQSEYAFGKPYSDKTAELIDQESKKLVEDAYDCAKDILVKNREGLTKLADLLLEREVIFSEDLEAIYGPRKSHTRAEELVKDIKETEKQLEAEEEKKTDQAIS
jgi:cell division protease FtsH